MNICGIDIGAKKIVCICAQFKKNTSLDIIENFIMPLKGIYRGRIEDLSSFVDSLRKVSDRLKKYSRFEKLYLSIPLKDIITRHIRTKVSLSERISRAIIHKDLEMINRQVKLMGVGLEEKLLHDFPQYYIIDEENKIRNPLGLYGQRLEVFSYLILCKAHYYENIIKIMEEIGWQIDNIVFSGLATGFAILEDPMEEAVVIDIGEDLTTITVFNKSLLQEVSLLCFGGRDLTEAIAKEMRLPWDLAEEMKCSYANIIIEEIKEDDKILIKGKEKYKAISRKKLSQIAEIKLKNFLKKIKMRLEKKKLLKLHSKKIYFTGGTVLLDGFLELAEGIFDYPINLGTPRLKMFMNKNSLPHYPKDIFYTTCLGLIYYGIYTLTQSSCKGGLFNKIIESIKRLYKDYF